MNTKAKTFAAKKLLWLAVGTVLLVNAVILGKVYLNRSEVSAQLHLSERELQLPYNYGFAKEDSSARVNLRWTTPNTEPIDIEMNSWRWQYDRRLQLSDAHFASFKFPTCAQKTRLRQKQMAWVLLEFNGPGYADYVAQVEQHHALIMGLKPETNSELSAEQLQDKRKEVSDFLADAKTSSPRLFVIDAAAERDLLEAAVRAHPENSTSKLLIVPAEVRASYYRCDEPKAKTTEIQIENLAVESLYIPKHLAQGFPQDGAAKAKAKFIAEIHYGRLHEPWINSLRHCARGCE